MKNAKIGIKKVGSKKSWAFCCSLRLKNRKTKKNANSSAQALYDLYLIYPQ